MWWTAVLGSVLLLITFYDLCSTTLGAIESGVFSVAIVRLYQRLSALILRKNHRIFQPVVRFFGIFALFTTMNFWFILLWISWALIFSTSRSALVNSSTQEPASVIETIYFAGYTITTLGIGDYVPISGIYQFLTPIAAGSGFVVITVAATFVLSVTGAVAQQRQLAGRIAAMGKHPQDIVLRGWDGGKENGTLRSLQPYLESTAGDIITCAQTLLCYPHSANYYYGMKVVYALPVKVAVLNEAINIIDNCIQDRGGLPRILISHVRSAIYQYLEAGERAGVFTAIQDGEDGTISGPSMPSLAELEDHQVNLYPKEKIWENYERDEVSSPRVRLLHLIEANGRSWSDLYAEDKTATEGA